MTLTGYNRKPGKKPICIIRIELNYLKYWLILNQNVHRRVNNSLPFTVSWLGSILPTLSSIILLKFVLVSDFYLRMGLSNFLSSSHFPSIIS